jgi:hypothetical protein
MLSSRALTSKAHVTHLHEHALVLRALAHLDADVHQGSRLGHLPVQCCRARGRAASEVDHKVAHRAVAVELVSSQTNGRGEVDDVQVVLVRVPLEVLSEVGVGVDDGAREGARSDEGRRRARVTNELGVIVRDDRRRDEVFAGGGSQFLRRHVPKRGLTQ